MNDRGVLGELAVQFALLSLMAFGGIIAVIPEMHKAVVDSHHWMSSPTFVTLFALAQAAPGPNVIVVALIGWNVAGGLGALVSMLAVSTPPFLITYTAARYVDRVRGRDWYRLAERGIAPVTVGLVLSSGLLLGGVAAVDWQAIGITALTAAAVLRWKGSPLIALGLAALAGLAGLV